MIEEARSARSATTTVADERATPPDRLPALDGLRGVAMVLVVLSHAWILIPGDELRSGPWRQVFFSGNFAVTIFFVVGGFLLVRGLIRERSEAGRIRAVRNLVRRGLRIALPVYILLGAVLLVAAAQNPPDHPGEVTRASLTPIATFTWNWWLQTNGAFGRPDLGHLWYVSVYLQMTVAVTLLCTLVAHRLMRLAGILALAVFIMTAWKFDVAAHETVWVGLLRTTTRGDAMLWGGLVAVVLTLAVRHRAHLAPWGLFAHVVGWLALVGLVTIPSTSLQYLRWAGLLACVATAAVVAAIELLPRTSAWTRPLTWWPLMRTGHASLSIYIWHYPLFFLITKHTSSWAWPIRTVVALTVLALVVAASRRWIERPVTALVDRVTRPSRDEDAAHAV